LARKESPQSAKAAGSSLDARSPGPGMEAARLS
jgi:hypothetical protein